MHLQLYCRSSPYPAGDYIDLEEDEFIRPKSNLSLFLGYTSNLVTSGLRETIRFLVQHKLVDCLVTTAGGVEEDIIKCLAPSYIGDFHVNDCKLRDNGINRAGNLLIPNENYCLFENWLNPLLDKMVEEQISKVNLLQINLYYRFKNKKSLPIVSVLHSLKKSKLLIRYICLPTYCEDPTYEQL